MRSAILRAGWTAAILLSATPSMAAGVDGLRFADEGTRAEVGRLQQRLQRLAADRTADVASQSGEIASEVARIAVRIDLSKPAIPKAGVVCSELLGPWFSQEPMLQDTNMAAVDRRTAFGRVQTAKCLETVRSHLLRNQGAIAQGMADWIAGRLANNGPIWSADRWCTGIDAQDNWWPLRSFYPNDLINGVVAGCRKSAETVLRKVAGERVAAAIATAQRVDRTPEAMAAAKWLAMPDFRISDAVLTKEVRERYEAAVLPILQQVTDESEEIIDAAYGRKVEADQPIRTVRTNCRETWTSTLYSSQADASTIIDKKCRDADAQFTQRVCKQALERASIDRLGWSKIMVVARANGSVAPVNFDALVCAAALDGFRVQLATSWLPFTSPSIAISPSAGGQTITVKLRKVTRENGANVWMAENTSGVAPLDDSHAVMTCFQSTMDDADTLTIVKGLGYMAANATGFDVTMADFFNLVGSGVSAAQCKTAKRGLLANAR